MEQAIKLDPTMLPDTDRQSLILEPFVLLSAKVSERFENSAFSSNAGFLKNEVLPVLARALRRLRPTDTELKAALARLVQMKELIGSKINLADLVAVIQEPAPKDTVTTVVKRGSASLVNVGYEAKHRLNAGKLMRLLAYFIAAVVLGLGFLTLVPAETKQSPDALLFLLAVAAVIGFGVYRASAAVTQGLSWGRNVGMAFGVFLLFGFPIGTALGAYLLWCLGLKWRGAEGR
jgi:hypothetical protein